MKKKKMKIPKKNIFLIVAFLLLIFFIASSLSKYVIEKRDTHAQESTAFYFESLIAKVEEGTTYQKTDWDGSSTQTIYFSVKNYSNNLLKTSEDITYKICAELMEKDELIDVLVYDTSNKVITQEDTCLLSGSDLNENQYELKIIPKVSQIDVGKEFNIQLTITSISPYSKQLTSNIKVAVGKEASNEINLVNSRNGEYITLNLYINNLQDVEINYDATKLILDQSNYLVNNLTITSTDTIHSFTIPESSLEKGKNYEINFIKITSDSDVILGTDIEII